MIILLQNRTTKLFFDGTGGWKADRSHAMIFSTPQEAIDKCTEQKFESDIVLAYPDKHDDVKIPRPEHCTPLVDPLK